MQNINIIGMNIFDMEATFYKGSADNIGRDIVISIIDGTYTVSIDGIVQHAGSRDHAKVCYEQYFAPKMDRGWKHI